MPDEDASDLPRQRYLDLPWVQGPTDEAALEQALCKEAQERA